MKYYLLNPDKTISECSMEEWARSYEVNDARLSVRSNLANGAWVSTVFLGTDHNFSNVGPPLFFETLAYDSDGKEYMERYATWDEAVKGHEEMCRTLAPKINMKLKKGS